jgi:hypothetical protein
MLGIPPLVRLETVMSMYRCAGIELQRNWGVLGRTTRIWGVLGRPYGFLGRAYLLPDEYRVKSRLEISYSGRSRKRV